ncbi:MAG: phosphatidylglycerophosphatase A [bacterium]|nr:phosphatidylglycerophosphatase A [bacterium]
MNFLIRLIATGFYTGYAPFASGTVGSVVGILLYLCFNLPGSRLYLLSLAICLIGGIWICSRAEEIYNEKDSSLIVWDEVTGYLVAMFGLAPTLSNIMIAFVIFRIMDIVKPYPIHLTERLPGGWGIMLDDVLAGLLTNVTIRVGVILVGP